MIQSYILYFCWVTRLLQVTFPTVSIKSGEPAAQQSKVRVETCRNLPLLEESHYIKGICVARLHTEDLAKHWECHRRDQEGVTNEMIDSLRPLWDVQLSRKPRAPSVKAWLLKFPDMFLIVGCSSSCMSSIQAIRLQSAMSNKTEDFFFLFLQLHNYGSTETSA